MRSPAGRVSGLIIDTPSSFASGHGANDARHGLIRACVEAFNGTPFCQSKSTCYILIIVNVIVVVGHEKLNVEMQRTYGSQLAVVKIPKSGGVGLFLD